MKAFAFVLLLAQEEFTLRQAALAIQNASFKAYSGGLLVVSMIALGAGAIVWQLRRWMQAQYGMEYCSPGRLWRELSHAHQLSRAQSRLLRRIAKHCGLVHPCEIFVEPTHLQQAAQAPNFQREGPAIVALSARLFGS